MFTKQQEKILNTFADLSDKLFDLGIITTDSFTGEIGEYIACKLFNLEKAGRATQGVDGVSKTGERYQVKAKISENDFIYNIKGLETNLFDFLTIVYFDKNYNVKKILRISSRAIKSGTVQVSASNINRFEQIELSKLRLLQTTRKAIADFAVAYNELEARGIIRSRRIVGDIGEYYACKQLGLELTVNKNEKGIDAKHYNGLTFEIKTRRVYESGRRVSETRRLNNLVGKSADYLVVVTLDRSFNCSGMWLIPMANLTNPKSANLRVVNNTIGTLNVVPSKISWLNNGPKFKGFSENKRIIK